MGYIYKPAHQRQLTSNDKYGKYNCTAYSAAMAIDRATLGGTLVTGKTVRANSNEPIPDPASPGMSIPQVVNVAFEWHVDLQNRSGAPWSSLLAALKAGRGVILQGDYDQIPNEFSCQASFDGPHCIYLNHVTGDNDLYEYDPLCWKPNANFPPDVARRYAEKWAKTVGSYPGLLFATTRVTPNISEAQ